MSSPIYQLPGNDNDSQAKGSGAVGAILTMFLLARLLAKPATKAATGVYRYFNPETIGDRLQRLALVVARTIGKAVGGSCNVALKIAEVAGDNVTACVALVAGSYVFYRWGSQGLAVGAVLICVAFTAGSDDRKKADAEREAKEKKKAYYKKKYDDLNK